ETIVTFTILTPAWSMSWLVGLIWHIKNVQAVVQDRLRGILKHPMVGVWIREGLPRQITRADNNCPRSALVGHQGDSPYPVHGRVNVSEVCEMNRHAWVRLLIVAQRDEAFAPIHVAVAQKPVTVGGPDEGVEVREIVWRVPLHVSDVNGQSNEEEHQHCTAA